MQTETVGTRERPIVRNCTTCSLYNMLSFYGKDQAIKVEDALLGIIRELVQGGENPRDFIGVGTAKTGETGYGVTDLLLIIFLEMLKMKTEVGLGNDPKYYAKGIQAIQSGRPFIIGDANTYTLEGSYSTGHTYVVYPTPNGRWMLADSNLPQAREIPVERIMQKLRDPNSSFIFVGNGPDEAAVRGMAKYH